MGLDIERGWVSLARTNLVLAACDGATGEARIIHADATRLPARVPTDLRGTVDLVLTSAPAGITMPAYRSTQHQAETRSSSSWAPGCPRIGRVDAAAGLDRVLAGCAVLLRPCGFVAIAVRRDRDRRRVADCPPGHVIRAGLRAGLGVVDYQYADHRGRLASRFRGDGPTQPLAASGKVILLPAVAVYDIVLVGKSAAGEGSR